MPCILTLIASQPAGTLSSGTWQAGYIYGAEPILSAFGWKAFPHNPQGQRTVAQVNAIDPVAAPLYSVVKMLDAGTINTLTNGPLEVEAGDAIGLMNDDNWYSYGPMEDVTNNTFHIRVSNRTVEEARVWLQTLNKGELTYESLQYDPQTDLRRVSVTTDNVTASGENGWTQEGVDQIVEAVDGTVVSVTPEQFVLDAILPLEEFESFKVVTQEVALQYYTKRRRFYINQSGLNFLSANLGVVSDTAENIAGFLNDGLND